MIQKFAETSVPINEIISKRWSPRAFDINKKVKENDVIAICEAARWAPSCINEQPWRFIVWDYYKNPDSYNRALKCMSPSNQKWVKNAPIVIASFANNTFKSDNSENRWGQHDTGLATQNILLQAFALGLVAHPLGGFEMDILKSEFNIPDNYTPMTFIAIGYQAEAEILDERNAKREYATRERMPLNQLFFDSAWENGLM